jgi:hypothetical protein
MRKRWIYTLAMSYGLMEAAAFGNLGPFAFFLGCGAVHLATKD